VRIDRERPDGREGVDIGRTTPSCGSADGYDNSPSVMREDPANVRTSCSRSSRPSSGTKVTEVSRPALRGRVRAGHDAVVIRALLEPFWPGRRAHAFDQFCR
jgi:hypothetical protein